MENNYNKDMAIIIPACDAYLDVFAEYMRYFKMNWADCPFELILVSETLKYNDERVVSITTSKDTEWTGRVIKGVKSTNCKYILTSIEDGFISERVNTDDVLQILEFIKANHIKYYNNPKRIKKKIKNPDCEGFPHAYKIRKNKIYGLKLDYVIWDREKLLEIFGNGTKNAWQIEEYFNEIALNSKYGFYDDMVSDKRNFLNIIETVSGGKWMPTEIKRLEKLGVPVILGDRGILPMSDTYRRTLHKIAYKIVPPKQRKIIKRVFRVLGYKFVTRN